ncbi:MAG: cysteine peptidase family C39 domain-containing protein, partial [Candidatus Omnitrophota bacterium]
MRRGEGINSEQLTQAQSHVEAEIERQEALQDLQNQNFSLTTENGILLEQISQNQVQAQSPDGSTLTTIQLDQNGNVIVADLQLSDGSIQVYQNGQLIGYVAPDGTQVLYENGEVQKIVFPDQAEGSLTYIDANHPALVLQNNSTLVFEAGAFSCLLDPQGSRHFYDQNAKLDKIVLSSGWALDNIILSADGASVLDYSVLGPQGNLVSNTGSVTHPALAPQTLYSYEGFRTQAEKTGWLRALQYNIVAIRDGEGRLTELKLLDLTIHYDPGAGAIGFIEKSDGTEIHDIVFDERGVIKDALVVSPDGEEKLYKDGQLTKISRTDLTKIFFVDGKPQTLITPANLAYNFNYETPGVIEANLDTALITPDAATAVKMIFNEDFSLSKMIRQNQEILSYLNDDLVRIDFPTGDIQLFEYVKDDTGKVASFSITEDNTETFYDQSYEPFKAIIHPTAANSTTLEITYQFGKIREVYKDGVLTFIYSYATDTDGGELTIIEDLEEKAVKTYKKELLLTSFEMETSVLSTYSYRDAKVSEVRVTRLGRLLHVYTYSYEGDLTIVTDEEGVVRTYDAQKKLIFLLRDNTKFSYTYHVDPSGKEIIEENLIQRTLEDGATVYYIDGQVSLIELPDGSVITDVVLDPHRNIVSALVTLTDGAKIIFNGQGILEKILPDGTHTYFKEGRIAKVIKPDGTELVYSYDKDQNGNITAIWIEVQNAALKYDPQGNLLGAHLPGILTPEETRAGTQDAYAGGRTQGAWSVDNDFNTAYLNGFGGGAGNSYSSLISEHTFPAPTTLTQFVYRLDASSYSSGSTNNGSYAYTYIETKDAKTGKWTTVPGTYLAQSHSNGGGGGSTAFATSANPATVNVTVSNVIAVRARSQAGAYANESGAHGGFAYIYEIQYSLADQTYFNFKKKTNPQGTVTGYSFQGLLGTISYDTEGTLLPGTPQSLNTAAQPLEGIIPSLVTAPYYSEINLSSPPELVSWFSATDLAVLAGDAVVGQEYSKDGVLETHTKADQTVTLFDNNKPTKVLSKEGEVLIEYAYDANGNPTRVYLKNARDSLPHEVAKAKQDIEEQRAKALLDLAKEKNLATGSIEANVETQRQTLLIQLDVLQKQYDSLAAMEVSGKDAKSQKGDALNQIGHAMDDVRNALGNLARDEAAAYAQLDQEVANLAAQLDAEAQEAFNQLAIQETNLKKAILKQEISPIVYDTYRRILGRDPSQTEYAFWTTEVDYDSGETFTEVKTLNGQNLTEALSQYLLSSVELAQREAFVTKVKQDVKEAVQNYLLLTQTEREVFASSLGLSANELIGLTAPDAQKILTWVENQTLHFGQSAFLSLEALLEQKGIPFAREDIAFRAIMVDILAGVITPLDDAELVISIFALDKAAALYGLDLSGAKLTYEDLVTLYQNNPNLKVIAHINQRHFVILTSVTEDSVTYIDTGAGPDKQNEIVTVTKEEFLGVWKGNVAIEQSPLQTLPGYQDKILSAEQAQKIRGAFLPFLFFVIANAIIGIVNAVIGVITAILAFIGQLGVWLGNILVNIGNALTTLSQGLQYVGKSIFGGIYHAATTLFNAFGTHFATFNSQALVGSLTKASFGEIIFERAVSIGLNFALSKGLEALGVDPQIIGIVTAFT